MSKDLILVRHAESTNNVAKRTLQRTLKKFKQPESFKECQQLMSLLGFPMNSCLSAEGLQMIDAQRDMARKEAFELGELGAEVILHSPLIRARDTAIGLFEGVAPMEESEELYEKSFFEHAGISSLSQRVAVWKDKLRRR